MSESTARKASHERYEFTWSTNSQNAMQAFVESPAIASPDVSSLDTVGIEGETEAVSMAPEQVDQVANVAQEQESRRTVIFDESSLHTFRKSPKRGSRFGTALGPLSIRFKLSAVAGWSCVAAIGAAAIVVNPGPLIGVRLAELGAVWGVISALVWFLPGRQTK